MSTPILNEDQTKAAWFIAHGRTPLETAEAVGVNKSTVHRWMKKTAFTAAVKAEKEAIKANAANTIDEAVSASSAAKDAEIEALDQQRYFIKELQEFNLEVLQKIRADGVEVFPVRNFPQFMKALGDAVTTYHSMKDRLIEVECPSFKLELNIAEPPEWLNDEDDALDDEDENFDDDQI